MTLKKLNKLFLKYNRKLQVLTGLPYILFCNLLPTVGIVVLFYDFWKGVALLVLYGLREVSMILWRYANDCQKYARQHLERTEKLVKLSEKIAKYNLDEETKEKTNN